MKTTAVVALGLTLFLSTMFQVLTGKVTNIVDYLTHQGVLQLAVSLFLVAVVFIPYLSWFRKSGNELALKYSIVSASIATIATLLMAMLFTIGISVLLEGKNFSFSDMLEIAIQVSLQFFQVGTVIVFIQWFFFALVFYRLEERASKNFGKGCS